MIDKAKIPDFMEDFVLNYFNPKCDELKNKLFDEFTSKLDYSVKSANNIEQVENISASIQNEVDLEFNKRYDALIKQCLKEYIDIQLDLFNNKQITNDQLSFRTSWIAK